jgi:transcriptional regulator with XRE-family HTH domain
MTSLARAIRELRGFYRTQEQFALEVGVTRAALARWETGATTPSLSHLQTLYALGLSPKFLLGDLPMTVEETGTDLPKEAA